MNDSGQATLVDSALRQARRERKRGCGRKEMLLLRKAVFAAHENVGLWNRYALCCLRYGREEEAEKAFAQSAWLDRRRGNTRRAAITLALSARIRSGELRVH